MKKELKRQIKQDELVSGVGRGVSWLRSHSREARLTAVIVAGLGATALAVTSWQGYRTAQADKALSEALETLQQPVASELADGAEKPSGPVFASAEEKYTKAQAAFEVVASRYGSTLPGKRARYYSALCRLQRGEYAEAEKALTPLTTQGAGAPLETALARLSLAETLRASGQLDKALAGYRQLLDDAALPLPKDHVMMRQASLLEQAQRWPEAIESYRKLSQEFPTSVYAGEARRKADYLKAQA